MTEEYRTGYKKPPRASQFKKGASGNPRGRPKGARSRSPSEQLDHLLTQKIRVKEGGIEKEMTYLEALQKKIVTVALNGSVPAMRLLQKSLERIDAVKQAEKDKKDANRVTVEFIRTAP